MVIPITRITGLIVSKNGPERNIPGAGYFKEYGIPRNGREYAWWIEESRKSLTFDWSPFISTVESFELEEIRYVGTISEGAQVKVPVKIRQRSQKLRDLAREHFRSPDGNLCCAACRWHQPDIEFACEIIEIHHTQELSTLPEAGQKLTLNQALAMLIPLCPTCHRMLHAKPCGGSFSIEELQAFLPNRPE